ncbi:hypothetical protein [Candidatus Lokiarchaeum ossiferum]
MHITDVKFDILVELGSFETKIGIAGDYEPKIINPSIFADSDEPIVKISSQTGLSKMGKERHYGNKALKFKDTLLIKYFLKTKDFSSFAYFLAEIFKNQGWIPSESNLIIVYPSYISKIELNELKRILQEIMSFPKFAFIPNSAAILTALGKDTGTIIDFGHFSTRIEGIFKGFPNFESNFIFPIGGHHITQYLIDVIFEKYQYSSTHPLYSIAQKIKEDVVESSLRIDEIIDEIATGSQEYDFTIYLPDGNQLTINKEKFLASELYFIPELAHIRSDNLIEFIMRSIRAWERDQIPIMLENIVLCGQGVKIPNLKSKLQQQIKKRFPITLNVQIFEDSQNPNAIWKGASQIYRNSQKRMEWE